MSFWKMLVDFFKPFILKSAPLPVEEESIVEDIVTPQLTKDVHVDDLACADGTPVPLQLWPNARLIAQALQEILNDLGASTDIMIIDAYRTNDYNRFIGGTSNSKHTQGLAVDFRVDGVPNIAIADLLVEKIDAGLVKPGEVGVSSDFVHYSVDSKLSRW